MNLITTEIESILYFNSIRNYTLSILDAFNNIKQWTKNEDGTHKESKIPITFGNYEKSIALEDIDKETYLSGNFNFIPRIVITFQGMNKAPERTTNKFQKISKKLFHDDGTKELQFGYNSVPYNFQYNMVIQARGLNQAFQIVEQIMPRFRPTYPISIQEYPIFDEMTLTQLDAEDPEFEIIDEFDETDVNIITVTIPLNLRGNLYMPLQVSGPIETVHLFNHLWEKKDYKDSQLASYYKFYVDTETGKVVDCEDEHYAPKRDEYDK
jgi:hypothetical protein